LAKIPKEYRVHGWVDGLGRKIDETTQAVSKAQALNQVWWRREKKAKYISTGDFKKNLKAEPTNH